MTEKSSLVRDLQKRVRCYHNSCPLRSTYGSGPKGIPIKEVKNCKRRFEKRCAGNE